MKLIVQNIEELYAFQCPYCGEIHAYTDEQLKYADLYCSQCGEELIQQKA